MSQTPFHYINSINSGQYALKDNISIAEYNPFITNVSMSLFADTIFHANEMNIRSSLPNKMQYDYYFNSVRPRKRWRKWPKKKNVNQENVSLICSIYKYNVDKAKKVLALLSEDDLKKLRTNNNKGGT